MSDVLESFEIYKHNLNNTFKSRYLLFTEYKNKNNKFDYSVSKFLDFIFEKFDGEKIAGNLVDRNTNPKYQWVQNDVKYPTRQNKIDAVISFWSNSSISGTNIHDCIENTYMKEKIDSEILPYHQKQIKTIEEKINFLEIQLEKSNNLIKRKKIEELRTNKKQKIDDLIIEKQNIELELLHQKNEKNICSKEVLRLTKFFNENNDKFNIKNIFPEFELYITEYPVYSFEFNINGRIDAIFRNKNTNKLILVDWKSGDTSNLYISYGKMCKSFFSHYSASKYMKFCMQLNLYRVLIEKFYEYEVEAMYVVLVDDFEKKFQIKIERIPEIDLIFSSIEYFKNFVSKK